jgi:hypothetical protein
MPMIPFFYAMLKLTEVYIKEVKIVVCPHKYHKLDKFMKTGKAA